jgi:hypothetical protein
VFLKSETQNLLFYCQPLLFFFKKDPTPGELNALSFFPPTPTAHSFGKKNGKKKDERPPLSFCPTLAR